MTPDLTSSTCRSCGASIPPGTGHYDTPHGLFCVSCGLRIPIIPTARVTVTVTDPEQLKTTNTRR